MLTLERVSLVQFFMFERLDFKLGEITGLFGPNGSGKSSFLDAVQIAMMGANARLVAFNAQATDVRTTRSIRSYCLGQYGAKPEDRVRQVAHTYITLLWRNTETNAPLSMGVCIYATGEEEQHKVLGRYILRDVELTLGDHLETVDGVERPREWETFRQQLKEHAKVTGHDPLHTDAERYIQDALLALKGANGFPNYDAFVRAFRFAVRMRFGGSPDEIIRNDVLETSPTNIRKFREITDSFQRLSALVVEVTRKINDGKRIRGHYEDAAKANRKAATWSALALDAESELASEQQTAADRAVEAARETLEEISKQIESTRTMEEEAKNQAKALRERREGHARHADLASVESERERAQEQIVGKSRHIRQLLVDLRKALSALTSYPALAGLAPRLNEAVSTLTNRAEPAPSLTLDTLVEQIRAALDAGAVARNALSQEAVRLEHQKKELADELGETREAIERVGQGKPPLSTGYSLLATQLRNHGLAPRHVCDLVEITDKSWQPAIESYLASNVEAIVVDNEAKAFQIYRDLPAGRDIYGLKIVRGSRVQTERKPALGTVAALIQGNDPVAVAFLRGRFGDMICADNAQEALAANRALTRDGMLVKDGTIERIRLIQPFQFKIGPATPDHKTTLTEKLNQLQGAVGTVEKAQANNQAMKNVAETIQSVDSARQYLSPHFEDIADARGRINTLETLLQSTDAEEYKRLAEEERSWLNLATTHNRNVIELSSKEGSAKVFLSTQEGIAHTAAEVARQAKAAALDAFAHPDCDSEFASSRWDDMLHRIGNDYAAMAAHGRDRHKDETRKFDSDKNKGSLALGEFLSTHHEVIGSGIEDDWRASLTWINDILDRLEATELKDYQEQLDNAYRASQETFRHDVAITLHENISKLDATMNRLNRVLLTSPPFSNGERYQFHRKLRKEHESLHKFIQDVAQFGPQEDLLGSAGEIPEQFRRLLEDRAQPGTGSLRSPLDDYREFFDFDIKIEHTNRLTGKEQKHFLSDRIGSGSGGEHRAPLYVIAGAALASAYKLDSRSKDGIRLILLDEAFQAMDPTNIIATMRYLEDLGLQVFMASPGENQAVLNAFLHRYYDIMKDPDRNVVYVEGHDLSEKVREICRSDLIEFHPELLDQEILEGANA